MKWNHHCVSDIKMAYVGGGSKAWAWKLMADLALEPALGGTVRLYDIDEKAARENQIIGNQLKERKETKGQWDYQAASSLKEALEGVDFVVISILPGTFEEMRSDVHLPERLGIYQSVGDTAGPGGMIRALRTLPMYEEIAEAIKNFCPKAWVISYTNPMSLCVASLYRTFPEIKAFGCCHEVFGTQKILAQIAEKALGIEKINREDIHVNVLGINHFTWFDTASYEGVDLFPIYKEYINHNFEEGFDDPDRPWEESTFNCRHRVKFDLFNRYGLIAAAGDRHLSEFMPGNTYLNNPDTVKEWKFGLTTVDFRIQQMEERLARRKRIIAGEEQMEIVPSGEEGVQQIKALVGLGRMVSNVNIPNSSLQIPNLPQESVVETNAVFSRDSIRAVSAGPIPEKLRELVLPHVQNHSSILEAAGTYDRELVVKAFMNDPLVKYKCQDQKEIEKLVDEMIKNTENYLPAGWK